MNFDKGYRKMMNTKGSSMNFKLGNRGLGYQNNEILENEEYQVGDKVAPGKEIGKDGEVKDSSVKKLVKAGGRGIVAYGTGGASLGKDKEVLESGPVDQAVGVISDAAENNKAIKMTADVLEKAGVTDVANGAMDVVGDLKEGKVTDAIKDIKKVKKTIREKRFRNTLIIVASGFALLLIIITILVGPVIGGMLDLTNTFKGDMNGNSSGSSSVSSQTSKDLSEQVLASTGINYNELSDIRKAIVLTASSKVGSKYHFGGKPTGPGDTGFPTSGLDCSGFVQWVLWTATDVNPYEGGGLGTSSLYSLIGKNFIQIREEDLQPGDIGLRIAKGSANGHTGVYIGDGKYVHAANRIKGVTAGKYYNFDYFLRYAGVE